MKKTISFFLLFFSCIYLKASETFLAPISFSLNKHFFNNDKQFVEKKPIYAMNFDDGFFKLGQIIAAKIKEKEIFKDPIPVFVMIWGYNGSGTSSMAKVIRRHGFLSKIGISYEQIETFIEEETNKALKVYIPSEKTKVLIVEGGLSPAWFVNNKYASYPDIMVHIQGYDFNKVQKSNPLLWEYLTKQRWIWFDSDFFRFLRYFYGKNILKWSSPRNDYFWDLIINNSMENPNYESKILKGRLINFAEFARSS